MFWLGWGKSLRKFNFNKTQLVSSLEFPIEGKSSGSMIMCMILVLCKKEAIECIQFSRKKLRSKLEPLHCFGTFEQSFKTDALDSSRVTKDEPQKMGDTASDWKWRSTWRKVDEIRRDLKFQCITSVGGFVKPTHPLTRAGAPYIKVSLTMLNVKQ